MNFMNYSNACNRIIGEGCDNDQTARWPAMSNPRNVYTISDMLALRTEADRLDMHVKLVDTRP